MKNFMTVALALVTLSTSVLGADYGRLTGQVVLDGKSPALKVKVAKGDPAAKDPAVCAASDVPNDEFVVNPANGGIANCFVYLKTIDKAAIHPSLVASKAPEVVMDQKNCQFIPHCLVVRLDQHPLIKSDDDIQHNTHTYPILNKGENVLIGANDRAGLKFPKLTIKERLPTEVKCDIHGWMRAWWLVVDHPYATVTDKDGKFTIDQLPAGEHKVVIWQELSGYVEKELVVTIKGNATNDLKQIKAPLAKFKFAAEALQ